MKYHLLAIPVGAELLLNASFAILGVAASSLVPWHRENLVDSCVQLLLGFSACCCALWPARSGGGAGAGSNTNGLTGRLLPDSSSSSSSSSSSAPSAVACASARWRNLPVGLMWGVAYLG